MKKSKVNKSSKQVSRSGASKRGLSASVPGRVSSATRSPARKAASHSTPGAALIRKRRNSKTTNVRGRFSTPDLRAVEGKATKARASGRRNKATARNASLRSA